MSDSARIKARCEHLRFEFVAFPPALKVHFPCKAVPFSVIAPAVSEDEIVAEIHQIPSPRDEVINIGLRR